MKLLSNLRNRLRKNILKSRAGQGATEYILLLVVVVGLVMIFKEKIKTIMSSKVAEVGDNIDQVKVNN
ncbi:MAG: Flp1 family type IVb pilin [Pseudobdellovibrio sp.]